jgi:hypothetical protein
MEAGPVHYSCISVLVPTSNVMESRPSPSTTSQDSEPAATVAEDLPELYRAILDRVGLLEQIGERREAGRIRVAATEAYSVSWNEDARNRLTELVARADRALAGPPRTRPWTLRRRSAGAR